MTKQIIITVSLLLLSLNTCGQKNELGYETETHKIYSEDNDEYVLKVTFPPNYDIDKDYKTLYYLDAYWLSDIILGSYTILNLANDVEDVVFIGITVNGSRKDWHKQRNMDFTPSPFKNLGIFEDLRKSDISNKIKISVKTGDGNLLNEEGTGGADLFLKFFEDKIIHFVENEYSNLNKRRGLLGHSFGGLFGFYTLQNRPELFKDYILIAASLSWNSFELVDNSNFSELAESESNIRIYHSYGEKEINATQTSNKEINRIITELKLKNLEVNFNPVKDTNHHSVLSRAVYDGLLFVYQK